ncbi:MAG: hypothetical protein RL007_548 [Bacteroidota bacterium]|jgi:hypothetical protein
MNILYVYCKAYLNLEEIELNLSGKHGFHLIQTEDKCELRYTENPDYPDSILNLLNQSNPQQRGLIGVTAIVGMNGTGKSHCLNLLKNILTDDLDFNQEVLVCYEIGDVIYCKHSLPFDVVCTNDKIQPIRSVREQPLIERLHYKDAGIVREPTYKLTIPEVNNTRAIFFSSHADLQSYPNRSLYPQHTDVSTNFLLQVDQQKGEEYMKEKFDPILSHKYQDTLRMIDLTYSDTPYPEIIRDFIPKTLNLLLSGDINFPKNTRNLSSEDESFIEKFRTLSNESWTKANLSERETPFEINVEAIAEHCRTSLCYNFLAHYFLNKEDQFEAESNVSLDDIDWREGLLSNTKTFFSAQKWVDPSIILNLFTEILNLIDSKRAYKKIGGGPGFEIELTDKAEVVRLTQSYYMYLSVYSKQHTSHPGGLINFHSRALSSGEKSMLTLFSRLYSASKERFRNPEETEEVKNYGQINTVTVLLDEGDASFHPEWQLKYFQFLRDFLPRCFNGYHIQLILTSHSPFILSDIPRENVIFLNKKNGKTIVENPDSIKYTFGGNIHELLANSFFLKDGLIGKYAQSRINFVIELIQSREKLTEEAIKDCKNLILSIGENVIRVKLLQMLAKKKALDTL